MPGFQKLESIRLVCQTGEWRQAIRNGNNAAWLCSCCNEEPLLGAGLRGAREKPVRCRRCGAHYQVEFGTEGADKNKPVRVVELPIDRNTEILDFAEDSQPPRVPPRIRQARGSGRSIGATFPWTRNFPSSGNAVPS